MVMLAAATCGSAALLPGPSGRHRPPSPHLRARLSRRHNEKTGEFAWIDPAYHTPWRELHDDGA